MIKKILALPPVSFGLDLAAAYSRVGTGRSAAALSYFLILTIFPLLVCVHGFIGMIHLDLEAMLGSLNQVLPADALTVLQDYLTYASTHQSAALLLASIFTLVVSASAGLRVLLHTLDQLYQVKDTRPIQRFVVSILLSLLFLASFYLSGVVILTGDWFFGLLQSFLPEALAALLPLETLGRLWQWIRYLLLFCFMLLLVLMLYWTGTPKPLRKPQVVTGTACLTAAALVLSSTVFSWFIGMSSRYALVYGSLASLIILLAWLYFCGNVLLLGAATGYVWLTRRSTRP